MRSMAVIAATALLPVVVFGCGSSANPSGGGPSPMESAGSALAVFDEDSVDVKPIILSRAEPRFPNRLREEYIGGVVWMEFIVDTRGRVEENSIKVICSSREEFETPAVIARRRFRYNAGVLGDAPVRTRMRDQTRFIVTRRGQRQVLPICDPDKN